MTEPTRLFLYKRQPDTEDGAHCYKNVDDAIHFGVLAYDLQADEGFLDIAFADAAWPAVVDAFLRDYADEGFIMCGTPHAAPHQRMPQVACKWVFRYTHSTTGPTANTVRFTGEMSA